MIADLRSLAPSVKRSRLHFPSYRYLPVVILLALSGLAQGQPIGQSQSQARGLLDVTIPQFIRTYKLTEGAQAWGDWDNDGRIDLVIIGKTPVGSYSRESKLYRNTGTGLKDETHLIPNLPSVSNDALAWGDYNRDDKLDLMLMGDTGSGFISGLYRNTGTGFEDLTHLLPNLPLLIEATATWADINRDGRPNLVLTGEYQGSGTIRLYINQGGSFVEQPNWRSGLPGVSHSTVAFGDYDSDGWLDLFISGTTSGRRRTSKLYHNTSSGFGQVPLAGIPAVYEGTMALGDYDRDGQLDLHRVLRRLGPAGRGR